MSSYYIEELVTEASAIGKQKTFEGIRIMLHANGGTELCVLRDMDALKIEMIWLSLQRDGSLRADDYLAGVVDGLLHCALTNKVPVVAEARLPDV